jgi:hypothetical protein
MLKIFLCLLFINSAFALSFDHYHSVDEINAFMKTEAKKNPTLATYKMLGKSPQNREIGYIILTLGSNPQKEAIYLNGTHHGNEKSSTEAVMGIMDYFLKNYQNPNVAKYLEDYALYLQPLVNPDGHALNTRETAIGIDPNRDYSSPTKKEENSFRQIEIQLIKKLVDAVKFKGAIAYHSGIVEILWPWCHTEAPSQDEALLSSITIKMAQATGVARYMSSHTDYPTNGEFIDYLHWKHGTVALTVELSKIKTPPVEDLPGIVQTSIKGVLSFMDTLSMHDKGMLRLPTHMDYAKGRTGTGRSAKNLE